jgi:hypothetical protein
MWRALALILAASGRATSGEPTLDISAADIALVQWSQMGDSADLRLTPHATAELERFTRNNVGQMVTVSIEGIPAARAVVQGVIDSGEVTVHAPSPALQAMLKAVRTQTDARNPDPK